MLKGLISFDLNSLISVLTKRRRKMKKAWMGDDVDAGGLGVGPDEEVAGDHAGELDEVVLLVLGPEMDAALGDGAVGHAALDLGVVRGCEEPVGANAVVLEHASPDEPRLEMAHALAVHLPALPVALVGGDHARGGLEGAEAGPLPLLPAARG